MDYIRRRKSIDALSSDVSSPMPQKACKVFGEWQLNLDAVDSSTRTRTIGSVLRKMTGKSSTRSRHGENTPALLRTRQLSDEIGELTDEQHPRQKHSVRSRRSCEGIIDGSVTHEMPKTSPIESRSVKKSRRSTDSLLTKRTEYLQRLHANSSKITKTKKKSPLTKSSLKRTPAMRKSPTTPRTHNRATPSLKSTVRGLVTKTDKTAVKTPVTKVDRLKNTNGMILNMDNSNVKGVTSKADKVKENKTSTLRSLARRLRRRSVDDVLDEQKSKRLPRRSLDLLETEDVRSRAPICAWGESNASSNGVGECNAANMELPDVEPVKTSRRGPRCGVNVMCKSNRLVSPRRLRTSARPTASPAKVKRMRNRILTNGLLKNTTDDVFELQKTPIPLPRRRRKTHSSAALLSPY